ncbi:MAG: SpoIIE family protein phosphatase [Oscillospiraceae bacterium]|nr:SpoIIE family protein phosphatase [Oscillospiraceae bacterium]
MTAVYKKINEKVIRKDTDLKNISVFPLILCCFIAFSAAKAQWADIPLSFLIFVLAAGCDDYLNKALISATGLVTFSLMSLADSSFIPYLIAQIAYITAVRTVKKEQYQLFVLCMSLAVCRIALVTISQPWQYSVYALTEAVLVCMLTIALKSGREIFSSSQEISFSDTIFLLVSGIVITLSLSGTDSRFLYTGAGAALAACWLFPKTGRINCSLICAICFFIALADKQAFPQLFVCGSILWLSGSVCSEKNSPVIYPVTLFTAVMGNLLFLAEFRSFALTGTAVFALIVYTALPNILNFSKAGTTEIFSEEKDYRQLLTSMQKLEKSLNFLGNCAVDISKLNEKNSTSQSLEDAVAEDICRNCPQNSHCWQEKYSFTSRQFSKYAKSLYSARERGFDMGFYSQCRQIEKLKTSFEENSRLLLSRKYILQSQKNNQKLLQNAFLSISAAVGDMIYQNQTSRLINTTFTMQLDRFLYELNIPHTYCLCSHNPDKATFSVTDPVSDTDLYRIKNRLESLFNEKFSDGDWEKQGSEYICSFYAKPLFTFEYHTESRAFREVNGDRSLVLQQKDRLYVLLSDGMGTGSSASAESRTVLAMAESLLNCGVGTVNVLNIINLALNLRGGGESGASLDILSVDLYSGKASLTKAGAGISMIINQNNLTRYYKDSLPLGMLKDVKYSTDEFTLSAEDTVVLMSDGVGDITANIRNLHSNTCREIARFAINSNKTLDDKTVIALRLKTDVQT